MKTNHSGNIKRFQSEGPVVRGVHLSVMCFVDNLSPMTEASIRMSPSRECASEEMWIDVLRLPRVLETAVEFYFEIERLLKEKGASWMLDNQEWLEHHFRHWR